MRTHGSIRLLAPEPVRMTVPRVAGDLLRAEQARPGSEFGEMISRYIREGNIVPMEVTIKVGSLSRPTLKES